MASVNAISEPISQYRKKRVAAYARVSVNTEELLHSLSAQISYYNKMIQERPDWEYVGVYADEGITGTSIKKRTEFKRLLADCEAGKVDIVLTKSLSRFARDTVDCLKTVRHLKDLGVEVQFERENISTFSNDGELLLTLLASFAQAESESIADNVRWSIRKKFEQGISNGHAVPFGYSWDGEMYRIIPEQGEVIKYIFSRYLEGDSSCKISKALKEKGIIGNNGVPINDSSIRRILANPAYMGILVLQKSFTERHVRRTNKGEYPQYIVEDMFEPLVSSEDFERVQKIRESRADCFSTSDAHRTRFSGLVRCGNCNYKFSRKTANRKKIWVCNTSVRKGKDTCDMRAILEEELEAAAISVIGDVSDEEFCRTVWQITIYGDRVEFHLTNGKVKKVTRKYDRRWSNGAFTGKLFCGECGRKLYRDTWGKSENKKHCWSPHPRGKCKLERLPEIELRQATKAVLKTNDYEAAFVEIINKAFAYDDRIEFHYKDGRVEIWQRK